MTKKVVAVALLLVTYNFLFLADSENHVKVGLVFLAIDVALWLPEISRRLKLN